MQSDPDRAGKAAKNPFKISKAAGHAPKGLEALFATNKGTILSILCFARQACTK